MNACKYAMVHRLRSSFDCLSDRLRSASVVSTERSNITIQAVRLYVPFEPLFDMLATAFRLETVSESVRWRNLQIQKFTGYITGSDTTVTLQHLPVATTVILCPPTFPHSPPGYTPSNASEN